MIKIENNQLRSLSVLTKQNRYPENTRLYPKMSLVSITEDGLQSLSPLFHCRDCFSSLVRNFYKRSIKNTLFSKEQITDEMLTMFAKDKNNRKTSICYIFKKQENIKLKIKHITSVLNYLEERFQLQESTLEVIDYNLEDYFHEDRTVEVNGIAILLTVDSWFFDKAYRISLLNGLVRVARPFPKEKEVRKLQSYFSRSCNIADPYLIANYLVGFVDIDDFDVPFIDNAKMHSLTVCGISNTISRFRTNILNKIKEKEENGKIESGNAVHANVENVALSSVA